MAAIKDDARRPGWRWARRLAAVAASLALTLLGLLLFTFMLSHLAPIDPTMQIAGDHASESTYQQVRQQLGLNQPLPVQFWRYLTQLAHGNMGVSHMTGQPVFSDLLHAFPATLELSTCSIILGALGGIALALLAVIKPGGVVDNLARLVSLLGYSVPIFWLGLLGLLLFYATLHWSAGPGRLDDAYLYTMEPGSGFMLLDSWRSGDRDMFYNAIAHLWLPVALLGLLSMATITRLLRSAMLEECGKEYVTLARANGAGRVRILLRHVFPNVLGTLITVVALSYASLLEGSVLTETVFAWPGIGRYLTTALFAAALLAQWIAPFDPNMQHIELRLLPPSAQHWLGTDGFGRDLLSRVIYGARPTLLLVSLILLLTIPIGLLVGIGAGYLGGWPERILMRVTDIFMSLPSLVIALAFVAILGPGLMNGALALALTSWPPFARQSRAETLALRRSDYLAAARMQGIGGLRLMIGHILPLCLPSAVVRAALSLGGIILSAAGLGFLGMGIQPPTAEWGAMVAEGGKVIFDQWWVAAAPGGAILLSSIAFNLLGDGLRDKMDPRHHEH